MNKIILLTLLLFSVIISYAENFTIQEYNIRAYDAVNLEPALSIYYTNLSVDLNVNQTDPQEYVNSLYIQSLAYHILEDKYHSQLALQNSYDYLSSNDLYFNNKAFYIDYFYYLLSLKEFDRVLKIISDKNLISQLNDRELIQFNIIKIEIDILLESESVLESIDQGITASKAFNFNDLLSSLLLIKADFISTTNIKKANALYNDIIDLNELSFVIKALIRLGNNNNNILYLEDAYLRSESLNSYSLSKEVIESQIDIYREQNNYKKLFISFERLNYINNRHLNFLLDENIKKTDFAYENFKLKLEVENKNSKLELFKLIIISLGVIIIFMTVFLSIQSYKLRY